MSASGKAVQRQPAGGADHCPATAVGVEAVRPELDPRDVRFLLPSQPAGRLVTSLAALAGSAALPAVVAVRRALGHLDPADYHIEVDIREVAADAVFEIVWTPVTAVVDLMLDWDLLDLEIGVAELAEWLDVEVAVARRALDRLSDYGGVTVDETLAGGVVVRLDLEACPLTSAQRPSPRLA